MLRQAAEQHARYVTMLKSALPATTTAVIELPADEQCPDCMFIEVGQRSAVLRTHWAGFQCRDNACELSVVCTSTWATKTMMARR